MRSSSAPVFASITAPLVLALTLLLPITLVVPSAPLAAWTTDAATGEPTLAWTPVADAEWYAVYGRTATGAIHILAMVSPDLTTTAPDPGYAAYGVSARQSDGESSVTWATSIP